MQRIEAALMENHVHLVRYSLFMMAALINLQKEQTIWKEIRLRFPWNLQANW